MVSQPTVRIWHLIKVYSIYLDQLQNFLNALNGPRFFTAWTSLQLEEGVVDSSYLEIGNKQLLAILTTSVIRVFELCRHSIFAEIQTLPSRYARSLKGFSLERRNCLAVAQSSQALRSGQENGTKSVIYCWNTTSNLFEKFQDIATRGALHVEYVSIGPSLKYLVFACSRYQGQLSSNSYVYIWSEARQEFSLLHYLPAVGAVRSSAVYTENSMFLSVQQVNGSAGSSTKIFAWNGTRFHDVQIVSSRAGYVFAAGRWLFIISSGTIYRYDTDSRNFTFHSTLQGPHDLRDIYEYFTTDNEHFLACHHFDGSANTSLVIYRLNGFDFVPYQNVSMPSGMSSVKVFRLREEGLVLAVMGGKNTEFLEWKHM